MEIISLCRWGLPWTRRWEKNRMAVEIVFCWDCYGYWLPVLSIFGSVKLSFSSFTRLCLSKMYLIYIYTYIYIILNLQDCVLYSVGDNLIQQSVSLLHVKDPLFKRVGASRLARFAIDGNVLFPCISMRTEAYKKRKTTPLEETKHVSWHFETKI